MSFKLSLTKTAAIFLAVAMTVSGLTFMTVSSAAREDARQEAETTYTSPAAGLSTETLLSAITSSDTSVDFLSVSSVAQTNSDGIEAAVEQISEYITQIESYVTLAYENAEGYSSAQEYYENAQSLLEQAEAAKEAAASADTYFVAEMYIEEVESMIEEAAEYAQLADEQAETAKEEEAAQKVQSTRQALVDYALSFVGVLPYRYGGSSLTSGADCSGFTMAIYASFGYSLPHSSSAQASCGRSVSISEIEIGDLVCYSGHVGIYIGNGMIVHSPQSGRKVSTISMYYSTIKSIRRIIE